MKLPSSLLVASLSLSFLTAAFAQYPAADSSVGAGLQIGTLGAGAHLTYDIAPGIRLRGEIQGGSFSLGIDTDDVEYDGDYSLFTAGVLAEFSPWNATGQPGGFQVAVGLYGSGHEIDLNAETDLDLGGQLLSIATGDLINSTIDYNSVIPYLGVGYDWLVGAERNIVISLDAGLVYLGDPEVTVEAPGLITSLLGQDFIDEQIRDIEAEVDDFTLYPVVKLGVTWRF